jgi:hypothetical protein
VSRDESLRQAIIAIRVGREEEARRLLSQILEANPRDEDAWLWMSAVVDTDQQRLDCFRRVLAINPGNAAAREAAMYLQGDSTAPSAAPRVETISSPQGIEPERRLSLTIIALSAIGALVGCVVLLGICLVSRVLVGRLSDPWLYADRSLSVAQLESFVTDAEYSLTLDRIVFISRDPPQLHIYDPATNTDSTVALSGSPTRVSVGPDGRFAAVSHPRHVSYVDLQAAQVITRTEMAADVVDVVFGSDGWVYAVVGRDDERSLEAVNIDTGERLSNTLGLKSQATIFRLHPDGNSLYGAADISSTEIEKIVISDGLPSQVYHLSSHDGYGALTDLWLSEDGKRIFTASGSTFRASSNPEQDMTYAGALANLEPIVHLVHSSSAGLGLAIPGRYEHIEDPSLLENQLVVFDSQHLGQVHVVDLPDLEVNGVPRAVEGRFVFLNAAGTQYYVIVQADPDLASGDHFGVVTGGLPLEALAASSGSSDAKRAVFPLAFRVIDAGYSTALDRIVMVSDEPAQLHVYDPASHTDTTVALSAPPVLVSVGPDGRFAVVGHARHISYVNLETAQLIDYVDMTTELVDVVLGNGGWVYAVAVRDDVRRFEAINMERGERLFDTLGRRILSTRFRLHPDGNRLYAASSDPCADIQKIAISDGIPVDWCSSRYHGDYPACAGLWLSDDGQRIFTACGKVFWASSDPEEDILYAGSLAGIDRIRHLVHSSSGGAILAVGTTPRSEEDQTPVQNRLFLFESENMNLERVVTLPSFAVNGQYFSARGRFVFTSAAGSHYYVIVQAHPDSALLDDFGLITQELWLEASATQDVLTGTPDGTASPIPPQGPYVPLPFRVIDAEYSVVRDRIVMISDHPSRLHEYDPLARTLASVDLSRPPTCVSVGPDGRFAAVGHDGLVSYVDLEAGQVTKTLVVAANICDVILAGNGWVYAAPCYDGHQDAAALHVAKVDEDTQTRVIDFPSYAGWYYRLHPNGGILYGAKYGHSPSDIAKTSISQGIPVLMYDSPYHGDYDICQNLWLSEDGRRIFTACGNVFRASPDPEDDMTYVGSLSSLQHIRHLCHSSAAARIFAVPRNREYEREPSADNQIIVLDEVTFTVDTVVPLPDLVVNGESFAADGRFVFVDATGTRYYVIVRADEGSGLEANFSIFTGEF